jgi:hypothetical protein
MGLPWLPELETVKLSDQTSSFFNKMESPGAKFVEETLAKLFQGVAGEVPEYWSFPSALST